MGSPARGPLEISNAGGTWAGAWTRALDGEGRPTLTTAAIGSGGYAGLEYRTTMVGGRDDADTLTVNGTIQPIE